MPWGLQPDAASPPPDELHDSTSRTNLKGDACLRGTHARSIARSQTLIGNTGDGAAANAEPAARDAAAHAHAGVGAVHSGRLHIGSIQHRHRLSLGAKKCRCAVLAAFHLHAAHVPTSHLHTHAYARRLHVAMVGAGLATLHVGIADGVSCCAGMAAPGTQGPPRPAAFRAHVRARPVPTSGRSVAYPFL